MISVKIDCKNLPEFINLMNEYPSMTDKNIAECLEVLVKNVEMRAKQVAPVDTGRLRADIGVKMQRSGLEGVIFNTSNVKYAFYVHEGTRRMKGRPYIREAIFNLKATAQRLLQRNFLKKQRGLI
jgi:HK97 gp10 family phage protein